MERLRLSEIAAYTKGRLVGKDAEISRVCTDSRTCGAEDLFVALAGERFDAHTFLPAAVEKGISAALVQQSGDYGVPYVQVDDTLKALGALAAGYRRRFAIPVVGITGSVGKTTTKEFVYAVVRSAFATHKSEGNFNNHIGLPLSVLALDKTHQAAIFEMGMNHLGEISYLTHIARPTIALITNIGVSHIENLGSQEGIRQAKLEIEEGLPPDGLLLLNADDPLLWAVKDSRKHTCLSYGCENEHADLVAGVVEADTTQMKLRFTYRGERAQGIVHAVGQHHVLNAAAAVLAGVSLGISLERCAAALAGFENARWRQHIEKKNGKTVIEDFYNASPDAMRASLAVLGQIEPGSRKVAILADMLELGEKSDQYHYACGQQAADAADLILAMGEHARYYLEGARNAGMQEEMLVYAPDIPLLKDAIRANIKNADTILIKGSRGMHLEQILDDVYDAIKE